MVLEGNVEKIRIIPFTKGSQGDIVKKVQELLKSNKYNIAVDGKFGPETYEAVLKFQETNQLKIDGIVGDQTWQALLTSSPTSTDPSKKNSATLSSSNMLGNNIQLLSSNSNMLNEGEIKNTATSNSSNNNLITQAKAQPELIITNVQIPQTYITAGPSNPYSPKQPEWTPSMTLDSLDFINNIGIINSQSLQSILDRKGIKIYQLKKNAPEGYKLLYANVNKIHAGPYYQKISIPTVLKGTGKIIGRSALILNITMLPFEITETYQKNKQGTATYGDYTSVGIDLLTAGTGIAVITGIVSATAPIVIIAICLGTLKGAYEISSYIENKTHIGEKTVNFIWEHPFAIGPMPGLALTAYQASIKWKVYQNMSVKYPPDWNEKQKREFRNKILKDLYTKK